jgi:hypothetical protein
MGMTARELGQRGSLGAASSPEATLKIKVDPWTGEVLRDPDRTSRVRVDPWTGDLLEVLSEMKTSPEPLPLPSLLECEGPLESALPPLGVVATIAATAGVVVGVIVTSLVL